MNRRSLEYWGGLLLVGLVGGALGATGVCVFLLKGNGLQNVISFLTLVILAITLWCVYKYVGAAQRSADTAEGLRDATFAAEAVPWVTDPIKVLPGEGEDKWLQVKLTNHGNIPIVNVMVCASWISKSYAGAQDVGVPPTGESFHAHEYEAWRIIALDPGKSQHIHFRDPRQATDKDRAGGPALGLVWYQRNFIRWHGCIEIYPDKRKDEWHRRLGRVGPFRGKHEHWPLRKDKPLPAPE